MVLRKDVIGSLARKLNLAWAEFGLIGTSKSMLSTNNPEPRRPSTRPRRPTWPHRIAEHFFGTLAKATLVIAALVVAALVVLEGGAGFGDLPTTRRGWRNLFLAILVALMAIAIGIYLVRP